jgi:hypothetical protein
MSDKSLTIDTDPGVVAARQLYADLQQRHAKADAEIAKIDSDRALAARKARSQQAADALLSGKPFAFDVPTVARRAALVEERDATRLALEQQARIVAAEEARAGAELAHKLLEPYKAAVAQLAAAYIQLARAVAAEKRLRQQAIDGGALFGGVLLAHPIPHSGDFDLNDSTSALCGWIREAVEAKLLTGKESEVRNANWRGVW